MITIFTLFNNSAVIALLSPLSQIENVFCSIHLLLMGSDKIHVERDLATKGDARLQKRACLLKITSHRGRFGLAHCPDAQLWTVFYKSGRSQFFPSGTHLIMKTLEFPLASILLENPCWSYMMTLLSKCGWEQMFFRLFFCWRVRFVMTIFAHGLVIFNSTCKNVSFFLVMSVFPHIFIFYLNFFLSFCSHKSTGSGRSSPSISFRPSRSSFRKSLNIPFENRRTCDSIIT